MKSPIKIFEILTTYLILDVFTHTLAAPRKPDPLWSCPSTPVSCIPPGAGIQPRNLCSNDTDCAGADRCCYYGCIKRCIAPSPCDRVLCEPGYACREQPTLCDNPPCALQANCIPEIEARCPDLKCPTKFCPAGYERGNDQNGCPTCGCIRKKECGPTCQIYCAYGNVMKDGCPTCECEPEPEDLCSNVRCGFNQECRLIQPFCTDYPCLPQPACVPVIRKYYDDTCGLMSRSLSGRPVLERARLSQELNCSLQRCPDHTVCSAMQEGLHVCCWQYTQQDVSASPKIGRCPQMFLADFGRTISRCEIDADCPGPQKCCYRNKSRDKSRYYGMCMFPEHEHLLQPNLCQRNSFLQYMLSLFGIC